MSIAGRFASAMGRYSCLSHTARSTPFPWRSCSGSTPAMFSETFTSGIRAYSMNNLRAPIRNQIAFPLTTKSCRVIFASSSFSSCLSPLSLFSRRYNSTAATTTTTTTNPPKDEEQIQGSASTYRRHLLICTGIKGNNWAKKPELSDPYLNLLINAVRGQEVKVNLIDEPTTVSTDDDNNNNNTTTANNRPEKLLPSRGPRHDLILFPDNIRFKNVRYEAFKDLSRYLEQHPIGTLRPLLESSLSTSSSTSTSYTTELVPGSSEDVTIELVSEPSAVLVCVHGARDCRCGEQGNEFYTILKDMVRMTGLSRSIKIYGISHIGGHKYAPNTIMYPSGDWHGHLSVLDSSDAQELLFAALGSCGVAAGVREGKVVEPVMVEKWRGRMGMNQQEVLQMYQQILDKRKERQGGHQKEEEDVVGNTLFAAPGEELYEDDGLKERPNALSIESDKLQETNTTTPPPKEEKEAESGAPSPQRVKVVFETFHKVRTEIDAKVGERILDIVKDKDPARHNVYQALECTCGGELECATCHVYIDEPYHARLPPVSDAEEDMLEYAVGRRDSSRLGCQIRMKPELEGMVIKLPQY